MACLVCLKSKRHWSPRFRQCDDIIQLFNNAFDFHPIDNIADVQIHDLKTAFCFGDFLFQNVPLTTILKIVLLSRGFESPPGTKATGSKPASLSISTTNPLTGAAIMQPPIAIKPWRMRQFTISPVSTTIKVVVPPAVSIRMRHSCYVPRRSVIHDGITRITPIFRRKT